MTIRLMGSDLREWVRAANPIAPFRGMADAQRSARLYVFALAFEYLASLPLIAWFVLNPDTVSAWAMAQLDLQTVPPVEAAFFTAMLEMLMTWGLVIFHVIYLPVVLVLMKVQWTKTTRWIPGVFLAFTGYGLLQQASTAITGLGQYLPTPPALVVWAVIYSLISTWIAWVSLRGAMELRKLERLP